MLKNQPNYLNKFLSSFLIKALSYDKIFLHSTLILICLLKYYFDLTSKHWEFARFYTQIAILINIFIYSWYQYV